MTYKIYDKNDIKEFVFSNDHDLLNDIYLICFEDMYIESLGECSVETVKEALNDDNYVFVKQIKQ